MSSARREQAEYYAQVEADGIAHRLQQLTNFDNVIFPQLHEEAREKYRIFQDYLAQIEAEFQANLPPRNYFSTLSNLQGADPATRGVMFIMITEESFLQKKQKMIHFLEGKRFDNKEQILQGFRNTLEVQRDTFQHETLPWTNTSDDQLNIYVANSPEEWDFDGTIIPLNPNTAALQPQAGAAVVLPPIVIDQAVLDHPLHGCIGACSVCKIPNRNVQL
jgi:hypothetical protein